MRLTIMLNAVLLAGCTTISKVQPIRQGRYMLGRSVQCGLGAHKNEV
jgi:hypothetical protein